MIRHFIFPIFPLWIGVEASFKQVALFKHNFKIFRKILTLLSLTRNLKVFFLTRTHSYEVLLKVLLKILSFPGGGDLNFINSYEREEHINKPKLSLTGHATEIRHHLHY